ncbi:MAG: Trk system potassium transporter TrkA [Planctomycetota bacterium]|jgi:trk system potassium uptake protein TrkA
MKILIAGAGELGLRLASELIEEGHQLFIVEENSHRLIKAQNSLDAIVVEGNASQLSTLEEAQVKEADMIIACTNSDEVNIIACLLAKEVGVKKKIARLRNINIQTNTTIVDMAKLGIDTVINPDNVTVAALSRMVESPGTTEAIDFAYGEVAMRAFKVEKDSPLNNLSLFDLKNSEKDIDFLIVAIKRNNELLIPGGDTRLIEDDAFYIFTLEKYLNSFVEKYKLKRQVTKSAAVFGGNKIALDLCKHLENIVSKVTAIVPEGEFPKEFSEQLHKTLIIEGNAIDMDLMQENNIGTYDYFLSISNEESENLMSCLMARKLGTKNTLAIMQKAEYVDIVSELPIDVVVNPLMLSVGAILAHVRRGKIISLVKAIGDLAETIEIELSDNAEAAGCKISSLKIQPGALIVALSRDSIPRIPDGDTTLQSGDRIIVFVLRDHVDEVMAKIDSHWTPDEKFLS